MPEEMDNMNDGPSSYVLPGPRREALYDLLTELCLLDEREQGELSDMERHEMEAERADIYQRLTAKADRLIAFMRHQESEQDKALIESKRLIDYADRVYREQQRLKKYIIGSMQTTGAKVITSSAGRVSIRKIKPSVVIEDEVAVPEQFWVTPIPKAHIDKSAIHAALDRGEQVPGVKRESEAYTLVVSQ